MQTKNLLILLTVLFAIPACSGGGSSSDSDPTIPQGDEDFVPPSSDNGSGEPSGATTTVCEDVDDCAYWFCECSDGAIVNTANCTNNFCLDAPSTCPSACEYFDHGDWSGRVGGGPNPAPDPDPNPSSCGTQGGTSDVCWSCVESECCGESAACYDNPDCLDYWDCRYFCDPSDQDCIYQCDEQYPLGVFDYEDLESCLLGSCSQDC